MNNYDNNQINIYQVYVDYQDIDAADIVFHGHYVDFAARARGHLMRQLFNNEGEDINDHIWILKDLKMDFIAPARLDELITIKTSIDNIKNCSADFIHKFFVNDKLIVNMVLKLVSIDKNYNFLKMNDKIKSKLKLFCEKEGA